MTLELGFDTFDGLSGTSEDAAAQALWQRLLGAIDGEIQRYQRFEVLSKTLRERGVEVLGTGTNATSWVGGVSSLLRVLTDAIVKNGTLQTVIDMLAAGAMTVASIVGLGEVQPSVPVGTWHTVCRALESPAAPTVGGELGWAAVATRVAAVLANPKVWASIYTLLMKVTPYIGAWLVTKEVANAVDSIAGSVKAKGAAMESCMELAASSTDPKAAIAACERASQTDSGWTWVLLGLLVGGGGLLYMQHKKVI